MSTLQERMKQLRTQNYLTQEDIALMLDASRATLANWETGRTKPDSTSLSKLADCFDVTVDYLLGRVDQTNAEVIAEDRERSDFWEELRQRVDLQLLFKQAKTLSPATINRVIKYIKMVESEELEEGIAQNH